MDHFSKQSKGHISSNSSISEKAVIDQNVIIEDNVRVFEGAVIRGGSYIGRNTVIGTGALVRDSIISDDCVVGYGTEVKHSYVGSGCWFHSNYIGDSILESDCSFGAGAITANFRLDEATIKIKEDSKIIDTETDKLGAIIASGCRIGINASLMPGIRIGAHTFVGSHVCLAENIEANKKVIAESHYRILSNDAVKISNKKSELMKKLDKSNH
jgi:bifunctional UDP-N-acetylglucosamine pyrophosphorylase/glucosamine-1-phosphate N-acetyltransferase